MSISKDQFAGRAKELTGAAKEVVGKIVGNDKLMLKGKIERFDGALQAVVASVRKEIKSAAKDVAKTD